VIFVGKQVHAFTGLVPSPSFLVPGFCLAIYDVVTAAGSRLPFPSDQIASGTCNGFQVFARHGCFYSVVPAASIRVPGLTRWFISRLFELFSSCSGFAGLGVFSVRWTSFHEYRCSARGQVGLLFLCFPRRRVVSHAARILRSSLTDRSACLRPRRHSALLAPYLHSRLLETVVAFLERHCDSHKRRGMRSLSLSALFTPVVFAFTKRTPRTPHYLEVGSRGIPLAWCQIDTELPGYISRPHTDNKMKGARVLFVVELALTGCNWRPCPYFRTRPRNRRSLNGPDGTFLFLSAGGSVGTEFARTRPPILMPLYLSIYFIF